MITSISLSPSIDRTVGVDGLNVGGLNRVQSQTDVAAGKGVNVALAAAALCQLGHNLLQLLFAPTLSAMDLSVQLPLLGVVFLLAALLLARLVARGYRLQQDNDLFI